MYNWPTISQFVQGVRKSDDVVRIDYTWAGQRAPPKLVTLFDYSRWVDLYGSVLKFERSEDTGSEASTARDGDVENEANSTRMLCTLGLISPLSGRLEWSTVPCDQQINVSVVICQRRPETVPRLEQVLYVDTSFYVSDCSAVEHNLGNALDSFCSLPKQDDVREQTLTVWCQGYDQWRINHPWPQGYNDKSYRQLYSLPRYLKSYEKEIRLIGGRECQRLLASCSRKFRVCNGGISYNTLEFRERVVSVQLAEGNLTMPQYACTPGSFAIRNTCIWIHSPVPQNTKGLYIVRNLTVKKSRKKYLYYKGRSFAILSASPGVVLTEIINTLPITIYCQLTDTNINHNNSVCDVTVAVHLSETFELKHKTDCPTGQYACADGHCINEYSVLDGHTDCNDSSDEQIAYDLDVKNDSFISETIAGNLTSATYNLWISTAHGFMCDDRRVIPWMAVCDSTPHCPSGVDETFCEETTVRTKHTFTKPIVTCQTSVLQYLDNDTEYLTEKFVACSGSRECIQVDELNDFIVDCSGGEDEPVLLSAGIPYPGWDGKCPVGHLHCVPGHPRCFPIEKLCVYDVDVNGKLLHCGNGAHLSSCKSHQCPGRFKCRHSNCLPAVRVCDGVEDCIGGEDESGCGEHLTCPGMFKCKAGGCITPDQVCDGRTDCSQYGDDESLCPRPCPINCQCRLGSLLCASAPSEVHMRYVKSACLDTALMPTLITAGSLLRLTIAGGLFPILKTSLMPEAHCLVVLNVSGLHIESIQDSAFSRYRYLRILDMSDNRISSLSSEVFLGLDALEILDMSHCLLFELAADAFSHIPNLRVLYLTANELRSFELDLHMILYMDIDNNPLVRFLPTTANVSSFRVHLKTSVPEHCCLAHIFVCVTNTIEGQCLEVLPEYFIQVSLGVASLIIVMHGSLLLASKLSGQRTSFVSRLRMMIYGHHCLMGLYVLLVCINQLLHNPVVNNNISIYLCRVSALIQFGSLSCCGLARAMCDSKMKAIITSLVHSKGDRGKWTILIGHALLVNAAGIFLIFYPEFTPGGEHSDLRPICSIFGTGHLVIRYILIMFLIGIIICVNLPMVDYCLMVNYVKKSEKAVAVIGGQVSKQSNNMQMMHIILIYNIANIVVSIDKLLKSQNDLYP